MQNAARNLVNQFNALLEAAWDNSSDRNTRALARTIEGAARISRRGLADIGITVGRDGFLSIDQNRMATAAENGRLERFMTGGENGQPNSFIGRVTRTTDSIIRNPLRHVSNHATRLPGFNAAWTAVRNGQNPAAAPTPQQQTSPYFNNNDWMSVLFDSMR
jgi:flagellar capping protein FliD